MSSDINNCRKSLKFLTEHNCNVFRVGEKSMVLLIFHRHKTIQPELYKSLLNKSYAKCSFYFGSSAHGIIPELFNKKYIINHAEHIEISIGIFR